MTKTSVRNPRSQRPGNAPDMEVATRPGRIAVPPSEAKRGGIEAPAPAPGPDAERGRYRRVFACATDPSESPSEEPYA